MPINSNTPASDYTAYLRAKSNTVGRRFVPPDFTTSLLSAITLTSKVAQDLGNKPAEPPVPPVEGDYGVLTGFSKTQYLTYSGVLNVLPGPYTVELFFQSSDVVPNQTLWNFTDVGYIRMSIGGGRLVADSTSNDYAIADIEPNTWYHVALTNDNSSGQSIWYVSFNGATIVRDLGAPSVTGSALTSIGDSGGVSITNFRVSNYARYTTSFDVPTLPFVPDITSDALLLLAKSDNKFGDSSVNKFPATRSCGWQAGPITYVPPISNYGYYDIDYTQSSYLDITSTGSLIPDNTWSFDWYMNIENVNDDVIPIFEINRAGGERTDMWYHKGALTIYESESALLIFDEEIIISQGWNYFAISSQSNTVTVRVNGVAINTRTIAKSVFDGEILLGIVEPKLPPVNANLQISNFRVYADTNSGTGAPALPLNVDTDTYLLLAMAPGMELIDSSGKGLTTISTDAYSTWHPGPITVV